MLYIKNLSVLIGEKRIISDFTYTFEKSKVYALMGPNGSGKSTLAHAIMGNGTYQIQMSKFKIQNEDSKEVDLTGLTPDERAKAGIFLSFQTPLALQGVRVAQLLQLALGGKKSALEIRKEVGALVKELKISSELIGRSLNENASGGERKKMEILQASVLDRPIQIFDEIDTGVDVDALKTIGTFLNAKKKDKTFIIITHYNRLLKYIKPDRVLVLIDGKLTHEGGSDLATHIEANGYDKLPTS